MFAVPVGFLGFDFDQSLICGFSPSAWRRFYARLLCVQVCVCTCVYAHMVVQNEKRLALFPVEGVEPMAVWPSSLICWNHAYVMWKPLCASGSALALQWRTLTYSLFSCWLVSQLTPLYSRWLARRSRTSSCLDGPCLHYISLTTIACSYWALEKHSHFQLAVVGILMETVWNSGC